MVGKKKRKKKLDGSTTKIETGCGNLFVTLNFDENGDPFELFNTIGKAGGCAASQLESIGRLVSLAFRLGASSEEVVRQLSGIHCHRPFGIGDNCVSSCADGVAKAIVEICATRKSDHNSGNHNGNNHDDKKEIVTNIPNFGKELLKKTIEETRRSNGTSNTMTPCPDCGAVLEFKEGCVTCTGCGYSECA